jgi:hypothetical protein
VVLQSIDYICPTWAKHCSKTEIQRGYVVVYTDKWSNGQNVIGPRNRSIYTLEPKGVSGKSWLTKISKD